jgi:hypothetical protein
VDHAERRAIKVQRGCSGFEMFEDYLQEHCRNEAYFNRFGKRFIDKLT